MGEVIVGGRRVKYDDQHSIGKGGEADVFDVGGGQVLKLFKRPDHPDLALDRAAQDAARRRIAVHQKKLPALLALAPKLPPSVVAPQAIAADKSGQIVGYVMPFLPQAEVLMRYAHRDFRQGVETNDAIAVLRDLHGAVRAVHAAGVVIGDFNDLNVLVRGQRVAIIDADSMQFGPFPCATYTQTFVDPTLCDPGADEPVLAKAHAADSDWYAFAVMVMQTLLFVGPYGGVARGVLRGKRPLLRLTVFDPRVCYPKPAVPLSALPDDLLHHFEGVFVQDWRGAFPLALLGSLRWTKCAACGWEHGRPACPNCSKVAPDAVKEVTTVRGRVQATRIFEVRSPADRILHAEIVGGEVKWLALQGGHLRREGGIDLGSLPHPDPRTRWRLRDGETLAGVGCVVLRMHHARPHERIDVDMGPLPCFDVDPDNTFWIEGGRLLRHLRGTVAPAVIGDVLRGQTMFWVGPTFGFGLYRAGALSQAFTFTASARSLYDGVALPSIAGQLVGAICAFTKDRAWFFTTSQEGARTVNRCTVIRADGTVEASAEAPAGDGSWLGKIGGACATGGVLLAPTDEGVVQVGIDGDRLVEVKRFPDTEPFVDSDSRLLAGADGLYVVTPRDITRLVIS